MTPKFFTKKLADIGFTLQKLDGGNRYIRQIGSSGQYIARDSVRGSAWRLFLAISPIPEAWPVCPTHGQNSVPWTEAESPWFNYFTDLDPTDPLDAQCDSRESALEKSYEWLIEVGLLWLANPNAKTDDRWRIDHNILVKHHTP